MTDEQTETFRQLLEAQLEELRSTLKKSASHSDTVELDQTAVGRLSRIDAIQAQNMAAAGRSRNELRVKQTLVALQALADGEYGECKLCGEDIALGRLTARPESAACVSCMAEMERR